MQLLNPSLLLLSLVSLAPTAVLSTLTITIPPSNLLPNPNVLPAGTHATLTSSSSSSSSASSLAGTEPKHPLTAQLTSSATFVFHDLQSHQQQDTESYLLDIRSAEYVFAPYRVDIAADGSVIGIWETFRGNPWDNRGAEKFVPSSSQDQGQKKGGEDVEVAARVVGRKGFYEIRPKFSPLTLFKNPMILLALVALGFTFGMPKLMENMDPEMRAEFEKQSRASPISGATQNAMTGGAPGNFDLAGWMAGAKPRSESALAGATEGAARADAQTASGRENRGARRRG